MTNLFSSQKPVSPKPFSPKPPEPKLDLKPELSLPSQTGKKDFYNTAFLPKIGNVDGSWWDPAYYMFYFTLVLILINTIYINVKTSGNHLVPSLVLTIVHFIITYFFTRSSSCLWAGGCQVFSVFNLIFPFLMIVLAFILENIAIDLEKLKDINYPEKSETSSENENSPMPDGQEEEEEEEEEEEVDGFSNTIEPFSSYYPY